MPLAALTLDLDRGNVAVQVADLHHPVGRHNVCPGINRAALVVALSSQKVLVHLEVFELKLAARAPGTMCSKATP